MTGEHLSSDTITSPLVNRMAEMAALRQAVARAAGGDPRVVLVEGDAGIGKSRLIAELFGELDEQDIMTLEGTCPPVSGSEMPLAPLAQALRALVHKLSADDLAAALGPSRAALAHLVPALGDTDIAPSPSEPSPSLILEHVLGVLERLSERNGPIVLVFEDLHWASSSVWDLLAFLARNLRDVRLAIIASYRRDGMVPGGRADQLLVELQRSAMVDAVALAPLGRADVAELVAKLGGTNAMTTAGVEAIIRRADGNPFFVEELVAAGAVDGAAVPASLRTTLLARISAQPASAQELLRIAAVIGRRVPPEVLIHASGAADYVVVPLLRGAVSAGILEHIRGEASESYAFRQGLMREVLYADLVPGERSRLHGTVARVLMARPESSPTNLEHTIEVASHWRQSGDLMRGVPALLKAAQAAEGAYAFSEAHALFEQAFALGARLQPAPIQRQPIGFSMESRAQQTEWPDLLARAAEAASLAGEPRSAVERIEAALAQAPEQRLERWRWAARRARYLLEAGRRADGLAAYEEAAAQAADASAAERARILVEHARALVATGQYAHGQEVAELAVTTARSGGQRAVEWQALNALGTALSLQGDMAPALEVLTAAHQLSAERSSPSMIRPRPSRVGELMGGYFDAARTLDEAGLRQDAVAAALEGAQAADRYGSAAWRDRMGLSAAAQLYGLGRWEEAGALVDTARARESGGAAAEALVIGSKLAAARGDWEQAQADLEAAEPLLDGDLSGEVVAGFYLATAERAYWRRQLRDGAHAIVSGLAASSLDRDRLPRAELCLAGVRLEAELHDEARLRRAPVELADHSETAARYTAEIQAILGDIDDSQLRPSAMMLTAQAELSRLTASSPEAWGAAALAWERAMEPYREAYAGWRLAEAHLLSGRGREEATRRLRDAWTVAQRLGARPLAEEIGALARRARIELTSPEPGSAAVAPEPATQLGLSSRELEILAVLARGLTNRQIAGELFITEKTAANHVSNILSKLGVSNRLEAAGIAYRVGLVSPGDDPPM